MSVSAARAVRVWRTAAAANYEEGLCFYAHCNATPLMALLLLLLKLEAADLVPLRRSFLLSYHWGEQRHLIMHFISVPPLAAHSSSFFCFII